MKTLQEAEFIFFYKISMLRRCKKNPKGYLRFFKYRKSAVGDSEAVGHLGGPALISKPPADPPFLSCRFQSHYVYFSK